MVFEIVKMAKKKDHKEDVAEKEAKVAVEEQEVVENESVEEEVEAVAHAADRALVREDDLVGPRRGARQPADDQRDDERIDEHLARRLEVDDGEHRRAAVEEGARVVRNAIADRGQCLE